MAIQRHEIDAQIETAMQTKLRHGYATQAVVVTQVTVGRGWTSLGFFFEDGHTVGEVGHYGDGSQYQVLAVV